MSRAPHTAGFTLIEVLGVMVLLSGITAVAIRGFVDLSVQSRAAADLTRDARRAAGILDRVAADLEGAFLVVKPDARDPLEHPWLFLAEARGTDIGADRVKFVASGRTPAAARAAAGDLAQMAYWTRRTAEGDLELYRWTWPRLPEGLDRRFPREGDPGVFLVADGLADFGVRLRDEAGAWTDRWDSSTVARSSQLPLAAEIEVWMADRRGGEPVGPFVRQVLLPLRPVDLAARLAGRDPEDTGEGDDEEDGTGDEDCLRV